ncbi:MAG: hypothetical protein KJN63_04215 [Acidimicrobiia bacterium]|nr:hypothetical protein [Acidimicrobiia bacterium]
MSGHIPPIGTEQGVGDTVRMIMEDRSYGRLHVDNDQSAGPRERTGRLRRLVSRLLRSD